MNRFTKRTDLESLWEEDGDLKRMKAFFHIIDTAPEENEQIKQSIKQKALEKISQEEALDVFPVTDKPGVVQRIQAKLRVMTGIERWKIGFSVVGLAILMIIGQSALNSSWNIFPHMGNKAELSQSVARAPQMTNSIEAGGPVMKGKLYDGSAPDAAADQKTDSSFSSAAPSAKNAAIAPLPPDQAVVPPADAGIPRKITYDLTLTLEVDSIDDTVAQITQEVQQLGGYIAESQQSGVDSHSSAQMTLKIPAVKLNGLQDSFSAWGKILDQRLLANDITNQYYDSQVRLQTLEAEEKRYLEILDEAKTVDDVLKVENALGNIRQQIEQLKGQLKLWNNQVDYSTVNLQLVTLQSPNVNVINPWQPISWSKTWQATQDAVLKTISSTWNVLNYLVVGVGYVLPFLLIGVLGWLVYRVWRK
ncbi:DUF4349 domain-containing protein [Desulfosporosinus sp. BG]|uniref:DUF4349 domain-containing protein n=1 Tax=Desulfosporosinus sp. BG TaxID=1633135 RepID=UPI00083AC4FC|nr:DUF4349 domain-containing protein [Desulfosporosinus sp. BG]ODA41382.1 hypothetical protein DSBG_1825 [Desulfosporosinus sp. BG]